MIQNVDQSSKKMQLEPNDKTKSKYYYFENTLLQNTSF